MKQRRKKKGTPLSQKEHTECMSLLSYIDAGIVESLFWERTEKIPASAFASRWEKIFHYAAVLSTLPRRPYTVEADGVTPAKSYNAEKERREYLRNALIAILCPLTPPASGWDALQRRFLDQTAYTPQERRELDLYVSRLEKIFLFEQPPSSFSRAPGPEAAALWFTVLARHRRGFRSLVNGVWQGRLGEGENVSRLFGLSEGELPGGDFSAGGLPSLVCAEKNVLLLNRPSLENFTFTLAGLVLQRFQSSELARRLLLRAYLALYKA